MWEAVRRRFAERRYALVQFFGGVQVYEYRDVARDVPRVIVPYESYSRFLENTRLRAEGLARGVRARAALAMARHYERTIYRGFDRVVVAAESEAACLRGLEPRLPTAVIPLGVDATWLRHDRAEAETSHRLLFVGNCAYGPNVDAVRTLVTEVFPRVRAELPATRVTIVGADPVREVMALAGSGVEITGWVPDVRPHLARATCLVAPIRQGTGMRFKILEAMAVGLPVVTTPLGCEGIAAAPGEDVLLGQDAAELAAAALRLMRDAPLRRKIAGRARELVRRRYTWERVVDQYEALYADVLAAWKAGAGRQSSGRGVARV
jgi:glycosyltransferase involved in cell wall biosynthesis